MQSQPKDAAEAARRTRQPRRVVQGEHLAARWIDGQLSVAIVEAGRTTWANLDPADARELRALIDAGLADLLAVAPVLGSA